MSGPGAIVSFLPRDLSELKCGSPVQVTTSLVDDDCEVKVW